MSMHTNALDLHLTSPQRRRLLELFGATGLLAAVGRNVALAQSAPDYKALVAIYLDGGNDGENTLVRYDTVGYQNYASVRTPDSGINIPRAQLLPIQPRSVATPFGFHPACGPFQALFEQKKLAVIANVGILAQPATKVGLNQGAPRPANLFSHSDQTLAMQSADTTAFNRLGWGGRMADRLATMNPGLFPPLLTTAGQRTFTSGQATIPLDVRDTGSVNLVGSGEFQFDALRDAAAQEILSQTRANAYDLAAQLLSEEGYSHASVVAPILSNTASIVPQIFAGLTSDLARRLQTVAMMVEGRAHTQLKRQVFFVSHSPYDTHAGQPQDHQNRLSELSQAIKAFQDAMAALGMENSVTTFTFSDFGRTFKPAAGQGTDHGWGGYAFVVGGAVNGGDFYGTLPTQALDGPDDITKEGRWIPTTSLEQYAAPMARWLGIAEGDLPYVFPNIGAFPNTNLGFMS